MELLERTAYLNELDGLHQQAARGHGRVLFLGGEAGVGKTSLVRAFADRVASDVRILTGACDPLSTPRPLGPLLDMSDQLGGEVAALITASTPRHELFKAVLDDLARGESTLMVVEDAHWADEATLDLLRYLSRRLRPISALLVVTYRNDEVGASHPLRQVLGDLATLGEVRRLELRPLSIDAVTQMAQGAETDPVELFGLTGGNPFYVTEVLALGSAGVPSTVRDAVLARASRLRPESREVLDVCAVIGSSIDPGLLESLGVDATRVDECLESGMLTTAAGTLQFRHDLGRQSVLESLSPLSRIELNRRVFEALRASPAADFARLAHYTEEVGDRDAVLTFAPLAARQAADLGSHRESAEQYARALRFASELPPAALAELLDAMSYELYLTGEMSEAISASERAMQTWRAIGDRRREGEGIRVLARLYWVVNRNRDAVEAAEESIEILESLPEGPELARAYSGLAQLKMLAWDWDEAIDWGTKAIDLADHFGETNTLVHALANVGAAHYHQEDERGEEELERSVELARRHGYHDHVARAYAILGSTSCQHYRFAYADRVLDEGIAFCAEHDLDFMRHYLSAWKAISLMYQGKWDAAEAQLKAVLRGTQHLPVPRMVALTALGRVQARRGESAASVTLDEALALALPTGELQRIAPVRAARAEAAWLSGDTAGVLREANDQLANAVEKRDRWLVGEFSYWCWRGNESSSPPDKIFTPFDLQIEMNWREATRAWKALACPYEAAVALSDSGGEADLRYAHAELTRLGAVPAAAMVAGKLRALGAARVPRGPRPSTQANPFQLTNRELEVLALLAEGRDSNAIAEQLYLSPRTIGHHITAILGKLGTRSRVEAVEKAVTTGIVPK